MCQNVCVETGLHVMSAEWGGQSTVCTPLTPQPHQMRSRNRCSSSLWRGRYYNLKVAELIVLLFIGFYFDVNAGGRNLYPFCRRPADR